MGNCILTRRSGGGGSLVIENGELVEYAAIENVPKNNFVSKGLSKEIKKSSVSGNFMPSCVGTSHGIVVARTVSTNKFKIDLLDENLSSKASLQITSPVSSTKNEQSTPTICKIDDDNILIFFSVYVYGTSWHWITVSDSGFTQKNKAAFSEDYTYAGDRVSAVVNNDKTKLLVAHYPDSSREVITLYSLNISAGTFKKISEVEDNYKDHSANNDLGTVLFPTEDGKFLFLSNGGASYDYLFCAGVISISNNQITITENYAANFGMSGRGYDVRMKGNVGYVSEARTTSNSASSRVTRIVYNGTRITKSGVFNFTTTESSIGVVSAFPINEYECLFITPKAVKYLDFSGGNGKVLDEAPYANSDLYFSAGAEYKGGFVWVQEKGAIFSFKGVGIQLYDGKNLYGVSKNDALSGEISKVYTGGKTA